MGLTDRNLTTDEILMRSTQPLHQGITVVLDDVRSRHNVGSIFRTADAFGVERIHLCGITPVPPHREIEKVALGATDSVRWVLEPNAAHVISQLKAAGYTVLAVEQTEKAVPLLHFQPVEQRPTALVFGNELKGISQAVLEACDGCLAIPQHGLKHSLNVSVCAGIVLWWLSAGCPGQVSIQSTSP